MALTQAQRDAKRSTVFLRIEEYIYSIVKAAALKRGDTVKESVERCLREQFKIKRPK